MNPPPIDVNYVAQLARLKLSPQETECFQTQLGQVLSHVEQLKQLNVDGIEPTAHAAPRINVFREDCIAPSLQTSEALRNAPQKLNDLFMVPKVVE